MKKDEVKINKEIVPCKDIQKIEPVVIDGKLMRKITYYVHEPVFHVVEAVVKWDAGYKIELKVRKAMLKY